MPLTVTGNLFYTIMLMIRLQRVGKKKQPSYRLVVSEKARDTQSGSLELLGHFNPLRTPKIIQLNVDRIKYWISKGAQPSNTLHNMFVAQGIIEGKKRKSVNLSTARKEKLEAKKGKETAAPATT